MSPDARRSRRMAPGWTRSLVAATALLLAPHAEASALRSLGQGCLELLRVPPAVVGDVIGGAALLGAASLATVSDTLALADRNPLTRGLPSSLLHRVAEAVSWSGTQTLEVLRGEPVERWPEAPATYREAAPFTGRIDTALSGGAALRVGVVDATLGPLQALARMALLESWADHLASTRRERAVYDLGPPPLPDPGAS